MQSRRIFVGSADGHVGTTTENYRDYLESAHHDAFDEFLAVHRYRWTPERPESMFKSTLRDFRFGGSERFEAIGMASLADAGCRLAEIDRDGVAVEVLMPDDQNQNTPPWLAGIAPHGLDHKYPPALGLVGARAYNRWLAEFCAAAPDRLLGQIALGSLDDVDGAVAEVRRAHDDGLRSGILLPLDYYLPLYHHERYEPLWDTCDELGLTVTVHAGSGGPDWYGEGKRASAIYSVEVMFYSHRPLWCFIFGGVFERHPEMKVAFTEQGSGWVPEQLAMLDYLAASDYWRWTVEEPLAMTPSEYFARHCFVGDSLMKRPDIDRAESAGMPNLMFGSDFPHMEGMWPHTRDALHDLFHGIPEARVRAIAGLSLANAYRIDVDAFDELVERIGPSPEELGVSA